MAIQLRMNQSFSFEVDDSPTTMSLSDHPAFTSATLNNVTQDEDPRFANFTSTLSVELGHLQGVTNVTCGDSRITDHITLLGMPSISNIVVSYLPMGLLSTVEVSWGKVVRQTSLSETPCTLPHFTQVTICSRLLRYEVRVADMLQIVNDTSCRESCIAEVNTFNSLGVGITNILVRAINEIGTSETATYPIGESDTLHYFYEPTVSSMVAEQDSGQYFTPQVNIAENCDAMAQCVPGGDVSEGATCSMQYTTDPTYMDLSELVMSLVNAMFPVQRLQPNTGYFFVFSVMVDILTVDICLEASTGK